MFHDDGEDREAYEDELYREDSSSDDSIDSEVEFYLYSQVHYSQNLNNSTAEDTDLRPGRIVTRNKQRLTTVPSVITVSDSDDIQTLDNSEVIILSDTLEEDSVYSTKTRRKGVTLQGKGILYTPATQSTPKENKACHLHSKLSSERRTEQRNASRNYKGGVVQEVLVIRGSSEDDEDSESVQDLFTESDSDQSDVENWMLLGGAKEDGDTSIQLNVEGGRSPSSTGEGGVEWSISERDSEAQIGKYTPFRRMSNRYYTDKDVVCRNCNKRGHLSKNCPSPRKLPVCCLCGERGHLQNTCPERYCSNCFQPGHFYRECIERAYWKKNCHRCSMTGHYADACPEIWRQYHLTIKPGPIKKSVRKPGQQKRIVYCCNCARKGHCNYECTEKTMYNGVYPSCQLVFTYDWDHEIRKRNERAKLKINELQEAGLLPYEIRGRNRDPDMQPSKKFKKSHWKESKAKRVEEKQQPSKKKVYLEKTKEKHRKKKRKLMLSQAAEEDFPRGSLVKSKKTKKQTHAQKIDKELFSNSKRVKFTDEPMKKKHKKKRHRKRGERQSAVDENLLLIKQRKKKSKKNSN